MPATPFVRVQHLRQVLQWRRREPALRWAAHTGSTVTNACARRPAGDGYLIWEHTVVLPMNRGGLANAYARVCESGRAEVLRTFGQADAALARETCTYTMRAQA